MAEQWQGVTAQANEAVVRTVQYATPHLHVLPKKKKIKESFFISPGYESFS
jgi:hypothetical protein